MNLSELQKRLFSLSVFRRLLDDEVLECLLLYLSQVGGDELACVSAYSELVSRLYSVGGNLTEYVKTLVYNDENVYIRTVGSGKTPDENLTSAVKEELITLSAVASLTPDELIGLLHTTHRWKRSFCRGREAVRPQVLLHSDFLLHNLLFHSR